MARRPHNAAPASAPAPMPAFEIVAHDSAGRERRVRAESELDSIVVIKLVPGDGALDDFELHHRAGDGGFIVEIRRKLEAAA